MLTIKYEWREKKTITRMAKRQIELVASKKRRKNKYGKEKCRKEKYDTYRNKKKKNISVCQQKKQKEKTEHKTEINVYVIVFEISGN